MVIFTLLAKYARTLSFNSEISPFSISRRELKHIGHINITSLLFRPHHQIWHWDKYPYKWNHKRSNLTLMYPCAPNTWKEKTKRPDKNNRNKTHIWENHGGPINHRITHSILNIQSFCRKLLHKPLSSCSLALSAIPTFQTLPCPILIH